MFVKKFILSKGKRMLCMRLGVSPGVKAGVTYSRYRSAHMSPLHLLLQQNFPTFQQLENIRQTQVCWCLVGGKNLM